MEVIRRRFLKSFLAVWYLFAWLLGTIIGNILMLFSEDYRNVWLFSERGIDARDNGYVFYKYIKEKHPEINSYYIIDKKSSDYEKVARLGNVVQFKSLKHYILLGVSKYNVSTHIMGFTPNVVIFVWLDRLHIIRGKKIYLQHGVIKDDMWMNHYPYVSLDIFVTSAKPEYEFIRDTYGHPDGTVKLLGLCRFDNLIDCADRVKKQILLMPTWRKNIADHCHNADDFVKTSYYQYYQSLLNNRKLDDLLEKYGYEFVFYPHYEMQHFLSSYSTTCKNIKIAPIDEYDVQELLIESKLLITDYSSVFFDFVYMEKPVIYYQFDEADFRKNHYPEGYFSYKRDGFGPVVEDEDQLLEQIENSLKNDCTLGSEYHDRISQFFTKRDKHNCDRVFQAIMEL
ncbi:CDP-glycerol glycerophosphotransferase family protein [Butyrivibrio sp. MB2005]|uniref:CDP-glycerol glycerophosphotransferase family protein n=1 Tax=Butyrivibrio sp. MB2005 TaxID=1280678 RepID=UPI00040E28F3|nr:CDP-glycerol glycerophosphotransferase family protein [Butyrivibrio sp. MB2005]